MSIFQSALSGLFLALSFPKFNLWWLAWLALIPFFIALRQAKNWKESLSCGLVFGVIFFGIDLSWVTSLTRFVGWWAIVGWGGLVLYQTLFVMVFSLVVYLLDKLLDKSSNYYSFFVALLWVVIEWLRAWGPFGVTGGDVGYSQVSFLPLIQIASLSTVYGISFLVVLFNIALSGVINVFLVRSSKFKGELRRAVLFLMGTLLLVGSCLIYGIYVICFQSVSPSYSFLKISLIQPNIDQIEKMNPRVVSSVYEVHEQLSRQAAKERPKIIVWPETAIFSYLLRDSYYLNKVKQLAIESQSWLVIGTPHYEEGKIYNSVVSISPSGEVISRYDKEHLVPFGEYLPFRRILYPFLRSVGYYDQEFSPSPKLSLLSVGELKVGTAICFESTFPDLIKKRVRQNASFILVVTNDAWFGDSSAPYFHLNTGVFRAVENRKYFIQVGNTGISAVIDPYGRILRKTKLNQREILTFEIPFP